MFADSYGDGWVGVAHSMFDEEQVYVEVDWNYWNKLTQLERLFLMYHEFGHAYFELWHNDVQIMKPAMSLIKPNLSWNNWLDWRKEMFEEIERRNTERLNTNNSSGIFGDPLENNTKN